MKSGKCPKCGSSEIYFSDEIITEQTGKAIFIKHGMFVNTVAKLENYACGQCNYVESYIGDEESMENIRRNWQPLNPRKSKQKNDD
jgi:predicted nucleic-acid-binding Zn-ribbon protein